ncbi:hypothetical protein LJC71_10970, partial [Desulfosarcina sp. OttesenSCG-928-A07]|nr:hypothetical protein [Desulfosarcina sp. OttesenSCG-928-A07]
MILLLAATISGRHFCWRHRQSVTKNTTKKDLSFSLADWRGFVAQSIRIKKRRCRGALRAGLPRDAPNHTKEQYLFYTGFPPSRAHQGAMNRAATFIWKQQRVGRVQSGRIKNSNVGPPYVQGRLARRPYRHWQFSKILFPHS